MAGVNRQLLQARSSSSAATPKAISLALAALLAGACQSVTKVEDPRQRPAASASEPLTRSFTRSWRAVKRSIAPAGPIQWRWAAAIPRGAARAELVVPVVSDEALAAFVRPDQQRGVRLASASSGPASFEFTRVGNYKIDDYAQLHGAVEECLEDGAPVTVAMRDLRQSPNAPPLTMEMDPSALTALAHAATETQSAIAVSETGTNWVVVHDGPLRGKISPHLERQSGMLQVMISLQVCWGPRAVAPKEVRAWCNGKPLRCLTVAESLELLYGNLDSSIGAAEGDDASSFAAVSERDDYILPFNYEKLAKKSEDLRLAGIDRQQPALARADGAEYPGPALLGDARALTALALRREWRQPMAAPRVGWILFAGESLKKGETIELEIDLASGPQRLSFMVPR